MCAGFLAGSWVEHNEAHYMESEAALIAAEQAGMKRMYNSMSNLIKGACVE